MRRAHSFFYVIGMKHKSSISFYERIGLICFLYHLSFKRPAFYFRKSFLFRLFLRMFPALSDSATVKKLDFGHVQYATHVMKKSFLNGKDFVAQMKHECFMKDCDRLFGIDFLSMFRMFVFSHVICPRYEFLELAIRFAAENPAMNPVFHANRHLSKMYFPELERIGKVRAQGFFDPLYFALSVVISPLVLWVYWKIKGQKNNLIFHNNIICNAVKVPTYEIYKDLFGTYGQIRYTISSPYLERYSGNQLEEIGIIPLRLSLEGYGHLRKDVYAYIRVCLSCHREISIYGSEIFFLFYNIILGRAKAPHGEKNLFITFEHFSNDFAIRNEFIRMESSVSVFFSKNLNIFSPYDFNEVAHNYDILCSSGKHIEILYSRNSANTKVIIPTGSYDMHKGILKENDYEKRITRLKSFKGNATAVTVLSTGLVDRSRSYEVRLMNLASRISRQPGIRVFIRMKSPFRMPDHNPFYDTYTENNDGIMLTGAEYELFDFLAVTNLFLTSFSSSACDVAMCGGQVFYVDFMKSPDIFLFQEEIDFVYLSEEEAFEKIMEWTRDAGAIRARHKEAMDRLKSYMEHSFPDYHSYKTNLIDLLRKHIP